VRLYEKGGRLGGQTLVAAQAPGREDLAEVQRYYTHQMQLLEVEVHMHSEVTAETIAREAPDAVVIATGSWPILPDLPTSGGAPLVEARAVLAGEVPMQAGQRVVVLAGEHHIQALSTADFLVDQGCQVEVLTAALHAGAQLEPGVLEVVYSRLLSKGVVITPLTVVEAIAGRTVRTAHALTHQPGQLEEVDLVVAAYGGQAADALYHAAREHGSEVHLIGDALAPRRLMDAILDGARLGRCL
jgi:pyruvate/2-oxoglutarate dehydrogenase complex dihydrolipoamide dehydrogenase (E3) component